LSGFLLFFINTLVTVDRDDLHPRPCSYYRSAACCQLSGDRRVFHHPVKRLTWARWSYNFTLALHYTTREYTAAHITTVTADCSE